MQEVTLDTLAQRMNRLEREVRRWRLGAAMLLTCAIAILVMGQTLPKSQVIEAQGFILKGRDGKVHAILGLHRAEADVPTAEAYQSVQVEGPGDTWGLHIFGSDGRFRAGVMSSIDKGHDGGSLRLMDKEARSRAGL